MIVTCFNMPHLPNLFSLQSQRKSSFSSTVWTKLLQSVVTLLFLFRVIWKMHKRKQEACRLHWITLTSKSTSVFKMWIIWPKEKSKGCHITGNERPTENTFANSLKIGEWVSERGLWLLWQFFGLIATGTRFIKLNGLIYEQVRVCRC